MTIAHCSDIIMECDICSRSDLDEVGAHCPVCARTAVYPLRLEAARTLLEKEGLGTKVELATTDIPTIDATNEIQSLARAWKLETSKSHSLTLKESLEVKKADTSDLRESIDKMRADIIKRRAATNQRKSEIGLIKEHVPGRQHSSLSKYNQMGEKGLKSFDSIHDRSVHTRAFLCREAASLLRFRSQRVNKDGKIRQYFTIAGHTVPNLRYIHRMLDSVSMNHPHH
jgi:hypothetical protein